MDLHFTEEFGLAVAVSDGLRPDAHVTQQCHIQVGHRLLVDYISAGFEPAVAPPCHQQDGDGSLLDHSMIVYGGGLSDSNLRRLHLAHKVREQLRMVPVDLPELRERLRIVPGVRERMMRVWHAGLRKHADAALAAQPL
jgi:hypothetical protein